MAVRTISDITPILKEVWDDEVVKQFDEGALLLDVIEHGDQDTNQAIRMGAKQDGKYVIVPLHTDGNPNTSVGVAEGYEYPEVGGQTYKQAKYRGRFLVSGIGLTSQTMSRASGGEQSVFNNQAREDAATIANIRRRTNFNIARDGSGILATATAYTNSTGVFTVDSTADLKAGLQFIAREKISGNPTGVPRGNTTDSLPNAWPVTTITTGNPAQIRSITNSTSFVAELPDGSAVWDFVPTAGAQDYTNSSFGIYTFDEQGRQIWGLDNFCSDANPNNMGFNGATTVTAIDDGGAGINLLNVPGGLDRTVAANAFWKAIGVAEMTVNLGGAAVTLEDHIQPLNSQILARDSNLASDEHAIIAVSRMDQWWQVVNALESGKRTEIRRVLADGQYDSVQYSYITFAYDQTLPAQQMLFFAPRYLYRMMITPWQTEDLSGRYNQVLGGLNRGTSKWREYLFSEQQLCGTSCRPNAKFTNIAA
jgi:hypothetical protein